MITAIQIQFARKYTAAWCSQDSGLVAEHFSPDGSLTINDGAPAIGRGEIAGVAQEYMTDFPDLVVEMDRLVEEGGEIRYCWTMRGRNSGPGGSGNQVLISGYEVLTFNTEGLIETAHGHYDEIEFNRQVAGGD